MGINSINKIIYARLSQNNNEAKNTTKPSELSKTNKNIYNKLSFTGSGSVISKFFNKLFAKNKNIVYSAEDAIAKLQLKGKKGGMYILTKKGFIPLTTEEFQKKSLKNISEIIFKQPTSKSELITNKQTFYYTDGLQPSFVIGLIKQNPKLTKITAVVDDGIQVLSIPKDVKLRKKILDSAQESHLIEDEENYAVLYLPDGKPNFYFDLINEMVENAKVEGLTLEKIANSI